MRAFHKLLLASLLAGFLDLSVCVVCAAEEAPESVRVATFNIYNYLSMDRRVEGRYRPDYPKPEAEKAGVRAVIHAVAPDVLALQELGPAPYLEELRQDLAQEGLVYTHSYLLEAADPARHVAVLSRIPFREVTGHPEVEFNYFQEKELVKRGLLEVSFGEGESAWTLFIVHLKSRFTDRPDDPMSETRRTLEARAVRNLILDRHPDPRSARFLVAGDFNDTTKSRTIAAFLHRGERVIAELLPTADSRGETWTHRYQPEDSYSRVDYVLASPGMRSSVIDESARIFDGANALAGTDHRMVYLDLAAFSLPRAQPDGTEPVSERSPSQAP
ncbi:MAG: endonuclease/exonuclease/phosphatase family protein [Opitutaceae bacterium]